MQYPNLQRRRRRYRQRAQNIQSYKTFRHPGFVTARSDFNTKGDSRDVLLSNLVGSRNICSLVFTFQLRCASRSPIGLHTVSG